MELTDAQHWALKMIKAGRGDSPGELGQAMMERPGAMPPERHGHHYKAQGYGRMGGAMMARLEDMGLVIRRSRTAGRWHPTKASLSFDGRALLEKLEADRA